MDVGSHTSSGPFEEYLCDKASALKQPILGTFELNPTCNMNCNMCYVRMDKKEVNEMGGLKSAEYWISLAGECMGQGLLFLLLTGGEPLLHPQFHFIFQELQKMGLFLTMNSNGTMIDQATAKFFRDHMLRRLNVTIYGKDDATYENLCHNPHGFTQLERAIGYLNQYEVPVRLNCSLTAENHQQLEDFYRIAEEWNVPLEISYYMFPPNRKSYSVDFEQYRMTPKETAEAAFKIQTHGMSVNEQQQFIQEHLTHLKEFKNDKPLNGGYYCRAGNSSFWVKWDGKMVPCGMMKGPEYNLEKYGFAESWKKMVADVSEIFLCEKCFRCKKEKICPRCAAGEISECGQYGQAPEYACKMADCFIEILRREYKQ